MPFPESYYKQYVNGYCTKIGQDSRGVLRYNFNNYGFINNLDYSIEEKNAICFFGSAITSAIGLPWEKSFGFQLAQMLGNKFVGYNFSQGCIFVDNQEIIETIKKIKTINNFQPYAYIVQFIDLDREFNSKKETGKLRTNAEENKKKFSMLFKELETLLQNERWIFFGCDSRDYKIPDTIKNHKNCLIWNPPFIDRMLRDVPGEKWHRMMALGLNKKFQDLYSVK